MKLVTAFAATALLALVACASSTSTQTSTVGTPRGTIAFGRVINANGDQNLFTIRADGAGEKQLVTTPSCCVVWSHRGDRLLLSASGTSAGRITTAHVKADGSDYRVLPLDSSLNLGPGAWSPDDRRMAFEGWDDSNPSRNGIYTADAADGGNRRRLTTTTAAQHDIPISYSPDGSRILFWRGPADASQPGLLFMVGVNGSRLTQVSPPGMTVGLDNGDPGGWSPDGAHISFAAFSPNASDSGRSAVFVAAGDGTNPKQITDWGSWTTSARWSPTGNWIVFDKINPAVNTHTFFLVHPDGSGIKIIPSLTAVCCAVWSPDGDRLLFAKGPNDQTSDLWTVMVDGSHLTQLTHTPAELTDLGWSSATR
jgi:Tol biopolymer transport system component